MRAECRIKKTVRQVQPLSVLFAHRKFLLNRLGRYAARNQNFVLIAAPWLAVYAVTLQGR